MVLEVDEGEVQREHIHKCTYYRLNRTLLEWPYRTRLCVDDDYAADEDDQLLLVSR